GLCRLTFADHHEYGVYGLEGNVPRQVVAPIDVNLQDLPENAFLFHQLCHLAGYSYPGQVDDDHASRAGLLQQKGKESVYSSGAADKASVHRWQPGYDLLCLAQEEFPAFNQFSAEIYRLWSAVQAVDPVCVA